MSKAIRDKGVTPRGLAALGAGLNFELSPPMAAFPNTKDIAQHPWFRGNISRFLWKLMAITITPTGRWFLVATAILAAAASIDPRVQPYVPLCYAVGIWVAASSFRVMLTPRVTITVRHADRVTVEETLPIDVEVTNTGSRNSTDLMVLPHGLPSYVDAADPDGILAPGMQPGEKTRVRLGLRCRKRGLQRLKGYRVETDSPFGMLRSYRVHYQPQSLLVYPKFHPLARLAIPTGRRYHPGGVALASNLGESFEFLGNREYQEGDNIRDIDWRATARLGRPIIREYREEYFMRVGVVLDTHIAREGLRVRGQVLGAHRSKSGGHVKRAEDFERAVSMAAAVSDYMSRQDYIVDLFAAGPNLYHLTAGRSLAYLDQILDILACVDESADEPFETLEPAILENLSKITTVICVFLDWNETRRAFVERIVRAGSAVKVIVVRDEACTEDASTAIDIAGPVAVVGAAEFDRGIEEL